MKVKVFGPQPYNSQEDNITQAEGHAIRAFREWQEADQDLVKRAYLWGMEELQWHIGQFREGGKNWQDHVTKEQLKTVDVAAIGAVSVLFTRIEQEYLLHWQDELRKEEAQGEGAPIA